MNIETLGQMAFTIVSFISPPSYFPDVFLQNYLYKGLIKHSKIHHDLESHLLTFFSTSIFSYI